MKTYELKNYKNIRDLKEDFLKDFNNDFQDLVLESQRFTECELLEATKLVDFNGINDISVDVSCTAGILAFYFRTAVKSGTFILNKDTQDLLDSYMAEYDRFMVDFNKALEEERKLTDARNIELAKIRAEKKAKHEAELLAQEQEAKFKEKVVKAQKAFEVAIKSDVKIEKEPIEWLRENVISVSATIPNYLEKAFIQVFGDVPHKVVDASRKTSGGYSMKFGPSFALTVKKDTVIHPQLKYLFKDNKIHDTAFISKLVRDGELSFGKAN